MKEVYKHAILWLIALITGCCIGNIATAQQINIQNLYKQYPIVKSNICPTCYLWINPYYKAIADVQNHTPVLSYELYHKGAKAVIKRTGTFSEWHSVTGQVDETSDYEKANDTSKFEIAKGHFHCYTLNSFSDTAAILSDTYTFNAAKEYQGQNIGTERATEILEVKLVKQYDVQEWCGGVIGLHNTPKYYWKVIKYGNTLMCWLMPNLPTETFSMLPKRAIQYDDLIKILKFDPMKILN